MFEKDEARFSQTEHLILGTVKHATLPGRREGCEA